MYFCIIKSNNNRGSGIRLPYHRRFLSQELAKCSAVTPTCFPHKIPVRSPINAMIVTSGPPGGIITPGVSRSRTSPSPLRFALKPPSSADVNWHPASPDSLNVQAHPISYLQPLEVFVRFSCMKCQCFSTSLKPSFWRALLMMCEWSHPSSLWLLGCAKQGLEYPILLVGQVKPEQCKLKPRHMGKRQDARLHPFWPLQSPLSCPCCPSCSSSPHSTSLCGVVWRVLFPQTL